MDCWTSRFSLWAAKPLAPSLGATLGLEGQDFELRGDFDSVSAPGVAVLGVWDSELGVAALGVWDSEPDAAVLGV